MKNLQFKAIAGLVMVASLIGNLVISNTPAKAPTNPSAVTLSKGSSGFIVAELQTYLSTNSKHDYFHNPDGTFTIYFGKITTMALKQWQRTNRLKPTGTITVGSADWNRLISQAQLPPIPPNISEIAVAAAKLNGWAIDANKDPSVVSVLRYNAVTKQLKIPWFSPAAYGDLRGPQYVTADGVFQIYLQSVTYYSQAYSTMMYWVSFFDGSEALHYDGLWPSHGCVHIAIQAVAETIEQDAPLGTIVVVHGVI
jgi:peptidoglycan hydrolase-like protein with peptidoglycan-binding domain